MKRVIQITFLLGLLSYLFVGQYLLWHAQWQEAKSIIKKQLKQTVPIEEMVSFTFTKEEVQALKWIKPKKEFAYRNSLFDVVYQYPKEGKIVLWCINDKQEHALFVRLDSMISGFVADKNSNQQNHQPKPVWRWDWANELNEITLPMRLGRSVSQIFVKEQYLSCSKKVESPPPEVLQSV